MSTAEEAVTICSVTLDQSTAELFDKHEQASTALCIHFNYLGFKGLLHGSLKVCGFEGERTGLL